MLMASRCCGEMIGVKNMSDLISRQEAIDTINIVKLDERYCDAYSVGFNDGLNIVAIELSLLLPAHPEIVRCEDCFMHGVCRFEQFLGLDGYCSKAERRTDE